MNSLHSKYQLEMLVREHDHVSQKVENLENERNHNRSSDLKTQLTSLKKWKLNIKDKIIFIGRHTNTSENIKNF